MKAIYNFFVRVLSSILQLFVSAANALGGLAKWTVVTAPAEIGAEVKEKQDADYIHSLMQHAHFGTTDWKHSAQKELTQMGINWRTGNRL